MLSFKEKRIARTGIAWLIIIAMFLCSYGFPFTEGIKTAYAAEDDEQGDESQVELPEVEQDIEQIDDESIDEEISETGQDAEKAYENVKSTELADQRDECTKYYQLENGANEAVLYGVPIHYLENGEYKEIDNSLSLTTNKDDNQVYVNKNNDFEVELSQNSGMASISIDNYSLSWVVDGISKSKEGTKESRLTEDEWSGLSEGEKRHNIANLSAGIKYEGIMQDIDLEYMIVSKQLKESIIFNTKTNISTITEHVTAKGLKLIQNDDGSIDAIDSKTEEKIFYILPTYLVDSKGEICEDIGVEMTSSGNDYTITYKLNKEWMEAAAYPVIFDPTATVNTGTDGSYVIDNRIAQGLPTTNYRDSHIMCTGNGSSSEQNRSLIKFTHLPSITSSKIYNATLKAEMIYDASTTSTVAVHNLVDNWDQYVDWDSRPGFESAYSSKSVASTQYVTYTWSITDIAKGWYSNNDGLQLRDTASSSNYKEWATWQSAYYDGPKAYFYYDITDPETPSVSTSPSASSSWTDDDTVTLSWSGLTDSGGSGLDKVQYKIDSGSWKSTGSSSSSGSKAITLSSSGTHTLYVRGVDNVGNYGEDKSIKYKLDVTAPVAPTSVTTSPVAKTTWTNDTTVNLSWSGITDANSGLVRAQYKIDSGSWTNISTSYGIASGTVPITISSSDTHTIYVRGVDVVGNNGANKSVTYKLDVGPPTAPTSVTLTPANWENGTVTIAASGATDALSDIQKYQYSTTSATTGFADIPENDQITLTSGDTTVYVRAVDGAGNAGIAVSANIIPASVTNFSVQSNVNYTVALKWTASVTPDVTYDIYRNESGQTPELIATGIDTVYWNDYNLNYDTTYFYSVVAVKEYLGATLESISTAGPQATVVSLDEVNKKVGKKDYEMFAEFSTQSGNGYINPASGNLMYETADISVDSPIGALGFVRSYNSLTSYSTPLGQGWDHNYNIILLKEFDENQIETGIILKLGNGNMYRFAYDSQTSTYTRPAGLYVELEFDSGTGKYTLTFKDKTEYLFNLSNQIERITDRNGNWIQFSYNGEGELFSAEDNAGNEITITYSTETGEGGLIKTVTGSGKTYTYLYSSGRLAQAYVTCESQDIGEAYTYTNGKLTTVTNPGGFDYDITYTSNKVETVTNPLSQVMTLAYTTDNGDLLVTTEFQNAQQKYYYNSTTLVLKKYIDALNHYTEYEYDQDFNLEEISYLNQVGNTADVEITQSYTFDSEGNLLTATDPYGYTTYYTDATHVYTEFGQPTITKTPYKEDSTIEYAVTTYIYNEENGNLETTTDPMGNATTYTYDDYGNVTQVNVAVESLTSSTVYEYDSIGRLITTNAEGAVTKQGYDGYGNIDWTEDANGARITYKYDVLGRCFETVYPGEKYLENEELYTDDDIIEIYTHDNIGNVLTTTTSYIEDSQTKTSITVQTYDDLGRLLSTISAYGTEDESTQSINYGTANTDGEVTDTNTDGEGIVSTTKYNAIGWVIRDECGDVWTVTQYDNCGNTIRTEDSAGVVSETQYDKVGRTIKTIQDPGESPHKNLVCEYTYELAHRTIYIDELGVETVTTYDKSGRPTNVKMTDTSTDPDTIIDTDYAYDTVMNGRLVSTVTDALGHVKEYHYNKAGLLELEVDKGDPTNATEMVTAYSYDDNGNMLSKTAPDDTVTNFTYDDMNRLVKTQYSTGYYIDYAYNGSGNQESMTQVKDSVTTTNSWEYDEQGRVIAVKLNGNTVVSYEYNANSQMTKMIYPESSGSRSIGYSYDENTGNLMTIADITDTQEPLTIREYIYDGDGVLTDIKDYRKFDQTTNDGDYSYQHFSYDTAGRIDTVTYYDVDIEDIVSTVQREKYDLTFDNNGNIVSEDIYLDYGTHADVLKEYEYDAFGRMITETVNSTEASYTYDDTGNRLTMTQGSNTIYYDFNEFNQLTQTANDVYFQNLITTFGYDDRGNQETQICMATDTVTTYHYDLANSLTEVEKQIGENDPETLALYWYDGAGQRIKKTEGEDTTRYYYDDLSLLYTDDGTTQRLEENIIEPDGSVVASKRFTGDYINKHYYYRQDIRGSITNIIDKDGAVLLGYTYDAYGNTTETGAPDFINSKAYTGAVNDETGLYYMNARYYNPQTGRFLTQDSYRGDTTGNPWPWHLYVYCDGDPVNNTDPSGHVNLKLLRQSVVAAASCYRRYSDKWKETMRIYWKTIAINYYSKYPFASSLLYNACINNSKTYYISSKLNSIFFKKIIDSSTFKKKMLGIYIGNINTNTSLYTRNIKFATAPISFKFPMSELDLYLSLKTVTIYNVLFSKTSGGQVRIRGTLLDKYDFNQVNGFLTKIVDAVAGNILTYAYQDMNDGILLSYNISVNIDSAYSIKKYSNVNRWYY